MENSGRLPYSDERLSIIMGINPCEFQHMAVRDEIKQIVREHNFSLDPQKTVESLKKLLNKHSFDNMVSDAIKKLIFSIELR